jgi:hypothetical protein
MRGIMAAHAADGAVGAEALVVEELAPERGGRGVIGVRIRRGGGEGSGGERLRIEVDGVGVVLAGGNGNYASEERERRRATKEVHAMVSPLMERTFTFSCDLLAQPLRICGVRAMRVRGEIATRDHARFIATARALERDGFEIERFFRAGVLRILAREAIELGRAGAEVAVGDGVHGVGEVARSGGARAGDGLRCERLVGAVRFRRKRLPREAVRWC